MNGSAITPFAWVFMVLSMGAVTALAVYCYYRILFAGDGAGGGAGRPSGSGGEAGDAGYVPSPEHEVGSTSEGGDGGALDGSGPAPSPP
ncbi:MAG: hypothetical protein ACE5HP_01800 [Gemmatimonadota bacterium]